MRRNRTITAILVLLCLLAALSGGVVLWRHYLPTAGPTNALFEKYKDNPHIEVCLLRDFQVNDTLAVDVTTLQATTDSAWCALLTEFGTPKELIDDYITNNDFFVGEKRNSFLFFYVDKNNIRKRVPRTCPNGLLVMGSFERKTLAIFITEEKNQKILIEKNEIKKLKNEDCF